MHVGYVTGSWGGRSFPDQYLFLGNRARCRFVGSLTVSGKPLDKRFSTRLVGSMKRANEATTMQRNRSAYTAFHLICIWTLQGSLVDLSIYIFEFVRCSEKKNERSGKHVWHLEVFLNTPFPSSKPPPPPFCPAFLAMNPINEEESKIPSDNANAQPMASC